MSLFFLISAVFHYLGPSFAVLLFARVEVRLKATTERDIGVMGPELASQAIRAGLVDEFQIILYPVIVGSGKRFFPDAVRLDLDLVEERRFRNGAVFVRYAVRRESA